MTRGGGGGMMASDDKSQDHARSGNSDDRKSARTVGPGVHDDVDGMTCVRDFAAARQVLRSDSLRQAGFRAELLERFCRPEERSGPLSGRRGASEAAQRDGALLRAEGRRHALSGPHGGVERPAGDAFPLGRQRRTGRREPGDGGGRRRGDRGSNRKRSGWHGPTFEQIFRRKRSAAGAAIRRRRLRGRPVQDADLLSS